MKDNKLLKLKNEAELLEQLLSIEAKESDLARQVLTQMKSVFERVRVIDEFTPLGRIGWDYVFIERELSKKRELSECYFRFACLAEGIDL